MLREASQSPLPLDFLIGFHLEHLPYEHTLGGVVSRRFKFHGTFDPSSKEKTRCGMPLGPLQYLLGRDGGHFNFHGKNS